MESIKDESISSILYLSLWRNWYLELVLNSCRYNTFVVFKSVTFENFQILLQIIIGIKINTFWAFSENFKSDTFEIYKSFVPVEVQSQIVKICRFSANASVIITLTTFADHTIYILKITILRTTQTSSTPSQF